MKKSVLFAFCLSTLSVHAASTYVLEEQYVTYANGRYGFSVDIPVFVLLPQGESDNGDGQVFESREKDAKVTVYGWDRTVAVDRICDALQSIIDQKSAKITYQSKYGNISVVSGYQNGNIFYKKLIQTGTTCKVLDIEYPQESRKYYDSITKRLANSFKG